MRVAHYMVAKENDFAGKKWCCTMAKKNNEMKLKKGEIVEWAMKCPIQVFQWPKVSRPVTRANSLIHFVCEWWCEAT